MTGRLILLALSCFTLARGLAFAATPESTHTFVALPANELPPVTVVAIPDKSAAWVVDSVTGEILYCVVKEGVTYDNIHSGNPVHCNSAQWVLPRKPTR